MLQLYPKAFIPVLFVQAAAVTCLIVVGIVQLWQYESRWISEFTQVQETTSYVFTYDYLLRRLNWLLVVLGLWFQLFFAIDAHRNRNAIQVWIGAILNALIVAIQGAEFHMMNSSKVCYQCIRFVADKGKLSLVFFPPVCQETQIQRFTSQSSVLIKNTTKAVLGDSAMYLDNAVHCSLAALLVMVFLLIVTCFLASKTPQAYLPYIDAVKAGRDPKQLSIMNRFMAFRLALKLNLYVASCMFAAFFYTPIVLAIHNPGAISQDFTASADDMRNGGFAYWILMSVAILWCVVSATAFYFVAIHAIRKSNFPLMLLFLVVYLVQIFITGRVSLFMIDSMAFFQGLSMVNYGYYMGCISAVQVFISMYILTMGSWLLYDFRNGLAELADSFYISTPPKYKQ